MAPNRRAPPLVRWSLLVRLGLPPHPQQPQGDRMTANRLKHIAPRIAPTVNARVVTLDIERIPGRARVKHRGLTIEGEFWDLSGWKHTIGRRIHADDVLERSEERRVGRECSTGGRGAQ